MIQASEGGVQEVVELVTVMQKVLELQSQRDVQIEGNVALVLSQYAEMLAAEGNLEAALMYLGESKEERITALRDRLCTALGYIQQTTQQFTPRTSITDQQNYQNQITKPVHPSGFIMPRQTTYDPIQAPLPHNNWNTTPTKPIYGTAANQFGVPQPGQFGAMPNQPGQSTFNDQYITQPYAQLPAVPAVQPLPPPPTMGSSSTGSRPSSVGPHSRSKYILDPSVKTSSFGSPYGNQNSFPAAPHVHQPQPQIPIAQDFSMQGSAQPQPNIPPPSFYLNSQQPQNPMYNQPVTDLTKSSQPNIMNPQRSSTQPPIYNPVTAQPPPPVQTYGADHSYQNSSQGSGWNDPPNANNSRAQVNIIFFH